MNSETTRAYYDDFSHTYDHGRDRGYHAMIDELELRALAPFARGKILEAGCGTGLLLGRMQSMGDLAVGVDLSRGMLARAHERGLPVAQASVTALPFADDTFDTVCSFKVLAHVPDLDEAIAELVRVTRPGGHLVLELYNRWSLRYVARRISGARRIGKAHDEDDISTRWVTPPEAIRTMPPTVRVVGVRGVRTLTPAAVVHRVGPLARGLAWAERAALDSPLRWFGGFFVLVLEKRAR